MILKRLLLAILTRIEVVYDTIKWRLRRWFGLDHVRIVPYVGYGTQTAFYLRGRALAGHSIIRVSEADTVWKNVLNMIRRMHTFELPRVRVRARFRDLEQEARANVEGYFDIHLPLKTPPAGPTPWYEVELELVDYARKPGAHAMGQVFVPPPDAQFAVISDLDDTVLQTDVLHLVNMARNTFLRNAYTRLPFKGVAAFYRALQRGSGEQNNPIFYVSNSPWNLYDLLVDFFKVRRIPLGPLFLTDLGLTSDHLIRPDPREHKLKHIATLMERYPTLPFILIGDSGEHDAEIYMEAVRRTPARVLAVYIRAADDTSDLLPLVQQASQLGVEMLLVPDTVTAANHAAERGFIQPGELPLIRQEREDDEQAGTTTLEKIEDAAGMGPQSSD